jgi:hypothetical protein
MNSCPQVPRSGTQHLHGDQSVGRSVGHDGVQHVSTAVKSKREEHTRESSSNPVPGFSARNRADEACNENLEKRVIGTVSKSLDCNRRIR